MIIRRWREFFLFLKCYFGKLINVVVDGGRMESDGVFVFRNLIFYVFEMCDEWLKNFGSKFFVFVIGENYEFVFLDSKKIKIKIEN